MGDGLSLYAFRVNGLPAGEPVSGPREAVAPPPEGEDGDAAPSRATRHGARREILAAARAVLARAGRETFTMPEVIAEMRRRGSGYADTTIRTMISAHLCADATGDGVAGYADLTRAGRGQYRFTQSPTG